MTSIMTTKMFKDLKKLPTSELKEKCREVGLHVSGTKADIIARLIDKEAKTPMTVEETNKWFQKQGISYNDVSRCLRAGIQRGFIKISGDDPLSNVVISDECLLCSSKVKVTIRDLLYQPDYAGHDYEDGSKSAVVKCPDEDCEIVGLYVTGMCCGSLSIDSGKFHNHCEVCPGLGVCMGDYRSDHCPDCGDHFYSCAGHFNCHCQGSDEDAHEFCFDDI